MDKYTTENVILLFFNWMLPPKPLSSSFNLDWLLCPVAQLSPLDVSLPLFASFLDPLLML